MAATIADVARLAGCSITTVSRAYSAPEKVREQTRLRIARAAEALHYSPNAIARAMVRQRNNNLAFVVDPKHYPIMINPFYAEMAEAVQQEAEARGYYVYITASNHRDLFMKKRVDGVVLAGQIDQALLASLRSQGMPVVQTNNRPEHGDIPSIISDDYQGTVQAMEHLTGRGHTRIGLLAGRLQPYISEIRYQAYCDVLARHGLPFRADDICEVEPRQEDACAAADALLARPDRPTALFCMNDRIAIGAMKAALRRGMRIPEELAVMGYDGSSLCTVIEPELTSVRVDIEEIGRRSAQILIDLIEEKPVGPVQIVVQPRLALRATT